MISPSLRASVVIAAVGVGTVVLVLVQGCLPNECDSEMRDESSCDGNVSVHHRYRTCSGYGTIGSPSHSTTGDTYSRNDCATYGQVCINGACVTPCTTDAQCPPAQYCSAAVKSGDGKSTCQPRRALGAGCTDDPTHCASGLLCSPPAPAWDAGAKDAAADGPATDASSAAPDARAPVPLTCQKDCSLVDAGSAACPVGAPSVCVGANVVTCTCGAQAGVAKTCDPSQYCVVLPSTGVATCALAPTPDPVCTSTGGSGERCDGTARVQCADGYITSREPCAAGERCVMDPVYAALCRN
jgi:hypothetical protein